MKRILMTCAIIVLLSTFAIITKWGQTEKVATGTASAVVSRPMHLAGTGAILIRPQVPTQESSPEDVNEISSEESQIFFARIDGKVFLTSEEIAEKQKYLSNRETIESNVQYLLQDRNRHYTRTNEEERLKRLKFLITAVEWKENPGRGYIRDALISYVERRTIQNELEKLQKKSIAADMITMVQLLAKVELNTAQRLVKDRFEEREKRILTHGLKLLGI